MQMLQAWFYRACSMTVVENASYCPRPPSTGLSWIRHLNMGIVFFFNFKTSTYMYVFIRWLSRSLQCDTSGQNQIKWNFARDMRL